MKSLLKFNICMPIYKGSECLDTAMASIVRQDLRNYNIIIGEDTPLEFIDEINRTENIINKYKNQGIEIIYIKNPMNLGYAKNLQNIVKWADGDVIYLMAQDDILSKDALQKTHDAFFLGDDIGVVTRPYYWFFDDVTKPVRVVRPYDDTKDVVLSIFDGEKEFYKIFESVGQLSGLAYKKEFISIPFNDECFPAHIYPFAGILREYKCVFLKDYTVAVGIKYSQTRSVSSIYDLSPTESWFRMYATVFADRKYQQQRQWGINHYCTRYSGLVQIKNYGNKGTLRKEIINLLKYRERNIIEPRFWFFAIGTILVPRTVLRKMVDWYKERLNSKMLENLNIDFKRFE